MRVKTQASPPEFEVIEVRLWPGVMRICAPPILRPRKPANKNVGWTETGAAPKNGDVEVFETGDES